MTPEKQSKVLSIYQHAINSIDDLLEYHYRSFTLEEMRLEILGYLKELTTEVQAVLKSKED